MKKKNLLTMLLALLLCGGPAYAGEGEKHTFRLGENQFWLDEKPFQIISGEMHPSRVPAEYWRHRIRMIKILRIGEQYAGQKYILTKRAT